MTKGPLQGDSMEGLKLITRYKALDRKMAGSGLSKEELQEYHQLQSQIQSLLSGRKLNPPANQRQSLRVSTKLAVNLRKEEDFKKVYLKNISGGGVYIECDPQPEMGSLVSFSISLEDPDEEMIFDGEVAWLNPKKIEDLNPGVGLKFVRMDHKKEKFIKRLIHKALDESAEQQKT